MYLLILKPYLFSALSLWDVRPCTIPFSLHELVFAVVVSMFFVNVMQKKTQKKKAKVNCLPIVFRERGARARASKTIHIRYREHTWDRVQTVCTFLVRVVCKLNVMMIWTATRTYESKSSKTMRAGSCCGPKAPPVEQVLSTARIVAEYYLMRARTHMRLRTMLNVTVEFDNNCNSAHCAATKRKVRMCNRIPHRALYIKKVTHFARRDLIIDNSLQLRGCWLVYVRWCLI